MPGKTLASERGFALVAALIVTAILFVFAMGLLLQTRTEGLVAANEHDHLAALGHADAGMSWAERRFWSTNSATSMLLGPDGTAATADDNLLGLRDLSLTATSQFTAANQSTASAVVSRDFDGQGAKSWEVIRIPAGGSTHGLVYVRVDDNFDDDPDDPANNDPLADTDNTAQVTVVAEYPVFTDANGVEKAAGFDRGRARRTLVAVFGVGQSTVAIATNGDLLIDSQFVEVCGDCGSVHSNGDLDFLAAASVCNDATADGAVTGSTSGVGGNAAGGAGVIPIPVVNPYDDLYVPSIAVFDTQADTGLPLGLRCPLATAADPGASKYFALVPNADLGEVWKAYWDFVNDRWTWRMIDDLGDQAEVSLDDCGRAPGDPSYASGAAGPVIDDAVGSGKKMTELFYGWQTDASLSVLPCSLCSSASADKSLCTVADNDFNTRGYFPVGGGPAAISPPLPGNFLPDGQVDYLAEQRIENEWKYSQDPSKTYSPLFGAVIFVLGSTRINGDAGATAPANFTCSPTAGCVTTVMPHGTWKISIVATGDTRLVGSANVAPANPDAGYHNIMIAGRDLKIGGNAQADTRGCNDSCPTTGPADVGIISGYYAAHEQLALHGSPNIFGMLVAEDAIDCSTTASPISTVTGNPEIYYDCLSPPSPWPSVKERLWWREVE